jgi:hypothetical protein
MLARVCRGESIKHLKDIINRVEETNDESCDLLLKCYLDFVETGEVHTNIYDRYRSLIDSVNELE